MYKLLKNTEYKLFPIVLGSDYYGGSISREVAFANMDEYVKNGGNIIDTARLYTSGESERIIGEYLRSRCLYGKLIISTKAAHPPIGNMDINRLSLYEIESDVDSSLNALGVECIDILWLHRDDKNVDVRIVVDALNTLIKKGKIKHWGLSNWCAERMEAAHKYSLEAGNDAFVGGQIQWSLAKQRRGFDKTLVSMNGTEYEYYSNNQIPVFAFASQAKGFFEKYDKDCLSDKARDRYLSESNVKTYEYIKKISDETGHSLTALSLAYLINCPDFDTFPIIGCSKTSYVNEAFGALTVEREITEEITKYAKENDII